MGTNTCRLQIPIPTQGFPNLLLKMRMGRQFQKDPVCCILWETSLCLHFEFELLELRTMFAATYPPCNLLAGLGNKQ